MHEGPTCAHVENVHDSDEDGLYGLMESNRHLSGEFGDSEEGEVIYGNESCEVSGSQTPLQQDRTDVQQLVTNNSVVKQRGYHESGEEEDEICAVQKRADDIPIADKDDRGTRGSFTEDEALKLAMAWVTQSLKMIQTVERFWNGVECICRETYGMSGRSKHSLRSKWAKLSGDCQM